jgi:catechol 2,3-dioxygenase-like lactoylglutathione lyase family enzyme
MSTLPVPKLCHFGIYARDLDKMVEFYTRIFGLTVSDRGTSTRGMDIAFLSGNPEEHHQLVIASGRPEHATFSTINQVSFRVNDLEELRRYYAWLIKEEVDALETRDHGNAWSIYFGDPEGNRMEVYLPSPWYVAQPCGEPLDLTQPVEKILATTEAMVRQDPSCRLASEWSAELRKKQSQPNA